MKRMKRTEQLYAEFVSEILDGTHDRLIHSWIRQERDKLSHEVQEDIAQEVRILLWQDGDNIIERIETSQGGMMNNGKQEREKYLSIYYGYAKTVTRNFARYYHDRKEKPASKVVYDEKHIAGKRDSKLEQVETWNSIVHSISKARNRLDKKIAIEVAMLIAEGYTVAEIAEHTNKPKKTVYRYLQGVGKVLNASTPANAPVSATRHAKGNKFVISEAFTRNTKATEYREHFPIVDQTSHALHMLYNTNTYKLYAKVNPAGYNPYRHA